MIIVTGRQLVEALNEKIIPSLMTEALKMHKIDFKFHSVIEKDLEEECFSYIRGELKWDTDTTLVFYVPNKDKKPVEDIDDLDKAFAEATNSQPIPTVLCFFFQNITFEKLTKIFNQIFKMKSFT